MLSDFTEADRVYIACGYTDLRRGIKEFPRSRWNTVWRVKN